MARESLADYGRRMAEAMAGESAVYVGGVSFGGMVALEMARYMPVQCVFLIASSRTGRGVTPLLRCIELASRPFSDRVIDRGRCLAPRLIGRSSRIDAATRQLLLEMVAQTPTSFISWAAEAMTRWRGSGRIDALIHQIHGAADPIIPVRSQQPDLIIPSGGHLINVTHAESVNAFIADRL